MITSAHITTSGGLISTGSIEFIRKLRAHQRGIEELTLTLVGESTLEARAQVENLFSDLTR